MTASSDQGGLEHAYLDNRDRLLRFLRARGAGDAAEDLLHEIWVKISAGRTGPVAAPLPYLFRIANSLMIDRHRSSRQAQARDRAWTESMSGEQAEMSDEPSAERVLMAEQYASLVAQTLDELGERPAAIFRRHRVDGVQQRQVAAEFGVSLSTVENDLRMAYRALSKLKDRIDEA